MAHAGTTLDLGRSRQRTNAKRPGWVQAAVMVAVAVMLGLAVGTGAYVVHNDSCPVRSRINESPALTNYAQEAGKNQKVQQELDDLVQRYRGGNANPGLGSKPLGQGISYLRGRAGGRVFYRMVGGVMEILGKASKANEDDVINELKQLYGLK